MGLSASSWFAAVLAQAAMLAAWPIGVAQKLSLGYVSPLAFLLWLAGAIMCAVVFFRLRPLLLRHAPAAGWTQVGALALAFLAGLVGGSGHGTLGFLVFAIPVVAAGTAIAHIVASAGLMRTSRVAGFVGVLANAVALAAGLGALGVNTLKPLLTGVLIGAVILGHAAFLVGLGRRPRAPRPP